MLRKLMKYEFKATARKMLPFMAVLIVFAILTRFISFDGSVGRHPDNVVKDVIKILEVTIFVCSFFAVEIVTLMVMLRRFKENVFGTEGYFTMTLPVTSHQIVWSKLIVSFVWNFSTLLLINLALIISVEDFYTDLFNAIKVFFQNFSSVRIACNVFWFFVYSFAITARFCLYLYTSITYGNMAKKHKTALSVFIFVGLIVFFAVFSSVLTKIIYPIVPKVVIYNYPKRYVIGSYYVFYANLSEVVNLLLACVWVMIGNCALYFLTIFGLKKKYNLD